MSYKETLTFSLLLALVSLCSTAESQITWRASVNYAGQQANGDSGLGSKIDLSADGRYVVYTSDSSNMHPGDTTLQRRVYRFDRVSGTSVLASIGFDGSPWLASSPSISSDGNLVVFNPAAQVYVRNMAVGQTEQASLTHDELQPNNTATSDGISGDGRYVMLTSRATNLVAAPPVNGLHLQVYVRDRVAGTTILVSQNSDEEAGNGTSLGFRMRGHQVMFFSQASNLVPEDPNENNALYVRNLDSGVLEVLMQTGIAIQDTDLSDDGRYMVYRQIADEGILLRDRFAGTTTRVDLAFNGSVPNGLSYDPLVSADGRFVTFFSLATNLLPPGMPAAPAVQQIYVRDMSLGRNMLVSAAYDGNYSHSDLGNQEMAVSARFVAFQSDATDLVLGDTGTTDDIFLRQFTFDCETPRIAAHPIAPVVCEDRPITLTVNAVGPDLQYQWSLNGVDIPGATAATYSVEHVDSGDAGLYLLRVSNDCGTVFSQVRVLVLTDMNGSGAIDLSDLAVLLSHFGSSGATYADGDLDGDGTVALADLATLLSVFGQPCP